MNRPPEVVETIPSQTLAVRGFRTLVDVRRYFRDPEGDPLIYAVESSNSAVVQAIVASETRLPAFRWWVRLDPVASER